MGIEYVHPYFLVNMSGFFVCMIGSEQVIKVVIIREHQVFEGYIQ